MKPLIIVFVIFLETVAAMSVLHSLQHVYTGSSGVPGLPQFVAVVLLDRRSFTYYDSSTREVIPRQEWMKESEGPEYWMEQTRFYTDEEHEFKDKTEAVKQQFNHTGDVYIFQRMFGCDWDNETGEENGYDCYGYDGDDYMSLDSKSKMWVAVKQQAFITKEKWNNNPQDPHKIYITHICPKLLKKYVASAGASLSKVSPTVSLLQRTPSSPVTCLATGFYPDRADVSWRRDGGEPQVDVDKGHIVPNNDGTFQMSAHLNVRSVRPEDWRRFSCVFQFSGDEENITIILDRGAVRTNWRERHRWFTVIPVVAFVLLIGCIVLTLIRRGNCSSSSSLPSDETRDMMKEMEIGNRTTRARYRGWMDGCNSPCL